MAERWLKGESEDPRAEIARRARGRRPTSGRSTACCWARWRTRAGTTRRSTPPIRRSSSRFIDATSEHIEDDVKAGLIEPLDPRETARALVLMTEGYLNVTMGHEPQAPTDMVVETLWTLWVRALYGSPAGT